MIVLDFNDNGQFSDDIADYFDEKFFIGSGKQNDIIKHKPAINLSQTIQLYLHFY